MILGFFSGFAQAVFALVLLCLAAYVLLELRIVLISRQAKRRQLAGAFQEVDKADAAWPPVSVLLPICNESAMVSRLIDAACRLRYPKKALEILVLDDSTDETSELAKEKVNHYAVQGISIRLIRRQSRKGYKAGNLVYGIRQATGEFFAILDADFIPPEDFLLKTIPYFKDPKLGFLQTGIGYENRDQSFLTRFQAMEMGHQQYVTVGLSKDGDLALLSGSSCVWRRSCVEALGGWSASTVSEDADLAYRAQFNGWKYAYLHDVVSMSVLPETASAFRVQRERWGRGLIHTAFRHLPKMLAQPMPPLKRAHALAVMFSSLLLASIYVVFLLTVPLNLLVDLENSWLQWGILVFYALVTLWALDNTFGARKGLQLKDRPSILRTLWETYLYVAMFLPMAWHYFAGGMRAWFGVRGDFHRTPKGHAVGHGEEPPRVNRWLLWGEVFSFGYSLLAIAVGLTKTNYVLIPLNLTACVGFGMMLYWSWRQRR